MSRLIQPRVIPSGPQPHPAVLIAALYRFARLADPAAMRERLETAAAAAGIKGTLILAGEGINGTIAGRPAAVASLTTFIRSLPGFAPITIKLSWTASMPFGRLKVRLKPEIVTMGVAGIDPTTAAGTYVSPADWNALIGDPGTLVVDTRNSYEFAIGSFQGAQDPGTRNFREFPAWIEDRLRNGARPKRVAMFCTGGIRCEKATAYVRSLGFAEVYHLDGGILRYLAEVPQDESRWRGACFVFDERVAVGHGLTQQPFTLCRTCGRPVTVALGEAAGGFHDGPCAECVTG